MPESNIVDIDIVKLPGAEHALIDVRKLRDYCLNLAHPRGKHKARVFRSSLALTQADAGVLRKYLQLAASEGEAQLHESDSFGDRYMLDFECRHLGRSAILPQRLDRASLRGFPASHYLLCAVELKQGAPMHTLSVVTLLNDIPDRNLLRGQVGTIVEQLAPGVYEVEFSDNSGRTYSSLALRDSELMLLHHELVGDAA